MRKTGIGRVGTRVWVGAIVLFMAFTRAATTAPAVAADTTPPVLTITSPANGAVISGSTITVTGTASDDLSGLAALTCNGQTVAVQPDNTFSHGPLALLEGFN